MRRALSLLGLLIAGQLPPVFTQVMTQPNPAFKFDTGNAYIEVIFASVMPQLVQRSPPMVVRICVVIGNACFDAIAPYHPTALGVYSRLRRRPAAEGRTNRNKNIALFYASYRALNSLLPGQGANWRAMMALVGLDPDDDSENLSTPIGIGNAAGRLVVAAREKDLMNQLGDLGDFGGVRYDRRAYADCTGYVPLNSPYKLKNQSRWQPLMVPVGNNTGTYVVQQFFVPQWGVTKSYSYENVSKFSAPFPASSQVSNLEAYQAQADEVISVQANLTDRQKMLAELFDNKVFGLRFAALFAANSTNMSLDRWVHYDFITNIAAFDGGIAIWAEKRRFDAVRPVSAIRFLYQNRTIVGWGGPGRGRVKDLPGSEWRSYLSTGNHPEYPSGTSCFCAAHAQASRRFLGSDAFGWSVRAPKGSSVIEPGATPSGDLVLGPWSTFAKFSWQCGKSRVLGGVHFVASVKAAQELCRPIGDLAFEFVDRHIRGVVSES